MFDRPSSKFKIKKFRKEIELQEILLDSLAQKKEKEMGVSKKKLETPLSEIALKGFRLVVLIIFFLLFGKTFQFQVLQGEAFSDLAKENEFVIYSIKAERGIVYDSDLNQLVFNKPSFDFICEGETTIEDLDHQTLILLEAKIEEYPECEIKNNTVRDYKGGSVSAHLLGYQRKTGEKTGLEEYYDKILKAKPGEIQIKKDVYGNPISKEIISLPESGQSLVLWLDSQLQKKLADALRTSLHRSGAKAGAAVALNPQNGGVLAMVSLPSFDNNLFSQKMSQDQWQTLFDSPQKPLFNRVIAGEYPVGSIIKPLIASVALQENIISPEEQIYAGGFIEVPHKYDPEIIYTFQDWKVHGWTDMRKAIAVSSNVYFYTIGGGYQNQEGLGPSKMKKYLSLFGWGQETQVDLFPESQGLIPDPAWKKEIKKENWWDGDTYHLSIGQGDILVTPIQVAASFGAIANGGTLYQPQIVKNILNGSEIEPKTIRKNFINDDNLRIVREGMRDGVIYGSSVLLNSLPVKAASKTGTAQTPEKEVYHNWVTVFAPYDNPQIVLTVIVENVKGMQAAALPVAKEVLDWYFSTLDRTAD